MKIFNVIYYDVNKKAFIPYDILPYFRSIFYGSKKKERPKTREELKEWIRIRSLCHFWSRCQYEIVLQSWPTSEISDKWDIHDQILMNLDTITDILSEEFKIK